MQAEGIFRINAENSQEEYVREQLNRGVVPDGIDVHCLAGLIKVLLDFSFRINFIEIVIIYSQLYCIRLICWCFFVGLVQRTSDRGIGPSFTRAGDAVPLRRGMFSACETSSSNRSCSARLGH